MIQSFLIVCKDQKIAIDYSLMLCKNNGVNPIDINLNSYDKTVGVGEIRNLHTKLILKPLKSKTKAVILDGANGLTIEAQNALLKIAEEPPARAIIILVTHVPEALTDTVRSRFQSIFVPSVPTSQIQVWLRNEERCDAKTAAALVKEANGAPGLAWALLHDEYLKDLLASAEKFFTITGLGKKDFLKELLDADSFDLNDYLDALIIQFAWAGTVQRTEIWHRLLKLRMTTALYNVNPRLQLEALAVG